MWLTLPKTESQVTPVAGKVDILCESANAFCTLAKMTLF